MFMAGLSARKLIVQQIGFFGKQGHQKFTKQTTNEF